MRLATRTFWLAFVPSAILLIGSFVAIQRLVVTTVRSGLQTSLRQSQVAIGRMAASKDARNRRSLQVAGESAALKAGMQLLHLERASVAARLTVEDQLREICGALACDFLLVADANGAPLVGVMRRGDRLEAIDAARVPAPPEGLFSLAESTYRVSSVSIDTGVENLGTLFVGEQFQLAELSTPAILFHQGRAVLSRLPGLSAGEVAPVLRNCGRRPDCEVSLRGEMFLAMRLDAPYSGNGYDVYSMNSVDAALAPVRASLRWVFLIAAGGSLLATVVLAGFSSRSIVRPIAGLISYLRESEKTGTLPVVGAPSSAIHEIRELANSFNTAARAIRESRDNLDRAYLQFAGSLASALDARDQYTAGHSNRVAEYSCAIASAIALPESEIERIRVGALLHDIGKIGIADSVLQKPGKLTDAEFAEIQRHPGIGRQILEGVNGFEQYLDMVELHHENWDGTGYPKGQRDLETPRAARILHVADAFDAMTSDRPYRNGMSSGKASRILLENAGTQFDPEMVEVFTRIVGEWERAGARLGESRSSADTHAMANALENAHAL